MQKASIYKLHYVTLCNIKMGNKVVRIDEDILEEVGELLCAEKDPACRLSSAQFVNLAVRSFIIKIKKNGYKIILKLK